MEIDLPGTAKTFLVETTIAEDGSLDLEGSVLALKPGEKVMLTISPQALSTGENTKPLLGTVSHYADPFGPATSPEEWEAARGC